MRVPILLAIVAFALSACHKDNGACIVTYDTHEECMPRQNEPTCTDIGKIEHVKSSRFETLTDEDRQKWENVKIVGDDPSDLICRRLYYTDCGGVPPSCRKK